MQYWLVDTAELQSVLELRVAAPEAVECRICGELKAALEQQEKTSREENQAMMRHSVVQ